MKYILLYTIDLNIRQGKEAEWFIRASLGLSAVCGRALGSASRCARARVDKSKF